MLEDGQRLGEFEILAKLGQGGMGAVYKARQTVLRRLVAIKTLQPSLSSDAEFISRFHNEAIAAAGLNHPNLVQVYAAGESDGIHWFAMEFVDGESVQSRLKRLGKLEPAEALAIGMHVQTALEYGWRKAQLIHRDIKPDNIFLSNDGEVKLGDLGLAKSSDQQQGLTMTGASMGTPLYISPEQTEGKRDIDLRTDIYSLGATLYHLIAGAPPYTGESAISVMMKHVGATVPDIREVNPSLPPAVSALLVKMMQKAPADRYGSYEELGVDLRQAYAALSDSGASAPAAVNEPAGAGGAAGKKRPAWLLPAVAVPLVALGAFALLKSKGPAPGEKAPLEAPQVAASETRPPVGKVPVENAKAETRPGVDSTEELVRKLEAKLLPVPGTEVLMSKTELTVGEWKHYLNAEGLPEWKQPALDWKQTDEHPVINVSWDDSKKLCDWLSAKTGQEWRLPTNAEWDAAVGTSTYPWGDYFPPHWDDGNYAILEDGREDPKREGVDGILGTAPVGSFRPNVLGFYDLGGNAEEWMWDGVDEKIWRGVLRGASWLTNSVNSRSAHRGVTPGPGAVVNRSGLRLVRVKTAVEKAESPPIPTAPAPAVPEKAIAPPTPAPAVVQMPPTPPPAQPTEDTTPKPPTGFRPLFDGATLNGWRGLNPHEVLKAAPDAKAALVQQQGQEFPNHWRVQNGELVNPGTGPFATTLESFGNIDLLVEYKATPRADGGIYLRGTPEIQIWDFTQKDTPEKRPSVGSGGLAQNALGSPGRYPLLKADKRFGEWNQFRIRQVGARTWVWLNDQQVVDGALQEPFWDKTKPLPAKAPILLQTLGGEIRWRNLFVHEIPDGEAAEILKAWNNTQIPKKNIPPKTPLAELLQRLEAKLLPIPGTGVRMCKTELTVREWKLYLKEAQLPDWKQNSRGWVETDEHPVVMISWEQAKQFCDWLSAKSGTEWRLPTNAEWDAAAGNALHPWGEYYPPQWDDGNYDVLEDGSRDKNGVGVDGIRGTTPVGSFKPNALGFYDLGGNAAEWSWDELNEKTGDRVLRGSSWADHNAALRSARRGLVSPKKGFDWSGLRLVRGPAR